MSLSDRHNEIMVHTGQHYDYAMSQSFFEQLGIPEPAYNLGVGSGPQGKQTGEMIGRVEAVLLDEAPDIVIVRGDTNSTLAGALAACKLNIPVVHVEAGERSYRRDMPEEINRILADQLASLHLCASKPAVQQLKQEGIEGSAFFVGDVMLDAYKRIRPLALANSNIIQELGIQPRKYSLVTIHRSFNTDDDNRLQKIVNILNNAEEQIVFPAHPRTREALKRISAELRDNILLIEPVGYYDILVLEINARLVATDSGGVQREAYFAEVPCLTLREETEWTETVEAGWNNVVGIEKESVLSAWKDFHPPDPHPDLFGDGYAAERISNLIDKWAEGGQKDTLKGISPIELLPIVPIGGIG